MPTYLITYEATVTVEAPDIETAVEATLPSQVGWEVTVDGRDFDPSLPIGCSVMTFPGSRIDQPEWCEDPVSHWDDGDPFCANHSHQPDDGPFGQDD